MKKNSRVSFELSFTDDFNDCFGVFLGDKIDVLNLYSRLSRKWSCYEVYSLRCVKVISGRCIFDKFIEFTDDNASNISKIKLL